MKFSVLISNHNYASYLPECVESVLQQTHPAAEIIVVDDGSTDDSLAVLQQRYGTHPLVKVIAQPNLGQCAAMTAAVNAAQGDVFCFLDSDDRYKRHYLEKLKACYEANPKVDFVFCRRELFGATAASTTDDLAALCTHPLTEDYDFGYTALLCYFGNIPWIGNTMSTLSLKRDLVKRLNLNHLRSVFLTGWDCHADNPLVVGSSLLGGRKYFLSEALVDYRCHHTNHWHTTAPRSPVSEYRGTMFMLTLFNYYKKAAHLSEDMRSLLALELQTVPKPMPEHAALYENLLPKPVVVVEPVPVVEPVVVVNPVEKKKDTAGRRLNRFVRRVFIKRIEALFK
jgi:glycosyltransferase involved in cell wall biosynthesis